MELKEFSAKDLEIELQNHPHFLQVKGTYTLSFNVAKKTIACSMQELQNFLSLILEALIILSSVKARNAPLEWAPLPGRDKEFFINKFQSEPHLYLEFLHSDPSLLRIKKNSDEGKAIYWKNFD